MAREYKDSGIEWIGRIPKGWETTKLFNLCTIKGRIGWNGLKSDEFKDHSYAYLVTGQDFDSSDIDWKKCYQIDKDRYDEDPFIQLSNGDILITKDGTIGKIAKVNNMDKPACLNSGIFVMKQRRKTFIQNYLYWYLVSPLLLNYNSYVNTGGTTIMHLYQNVFERFPLLIPPHDIQQRIANYLDEKCKEIDSLISLQEQMIAQLTDYKQSVITEAVTKGLDPNAQLIPSGIDWIGDIPKGWEYVKLKGITDRIGDGLHGTPIYVADSSIYFINGNNLGKKNIEIYASTNKVDKAEYDKYYIELNSKTILISLNGTIGNLSFYNGEEIILGKSAGYIVLKDHIFKDFMYYCLLAQNIKEYFILSLSGTTIGNLSLRTLRNTPIALPPLAEQHAIADYLDNKCAEIDALIALKQQKMETLKDYKKSLIYETVTGKIEVV